ncbi:hypothetical protein HMPREF1870_01441 [Bacteroidales bacterium KA00344]|nr:hypothetical protein HMPREF1870_01441 [Bacteroidales bacterium KA00344]
MQIYKDNSIAPRNDMEFYDAPIDMPSTYSKPSQGRHCLTWLKM